jgi:hypothetical protein
MSFIAADIEEPPATVFSYFPERLPGTEGLTGIGPGSQKRLFKACQTTKTFALAEIRRCETPFVGS